MGFLEYEGEPLPFNEIRPHIEHVKRHGILQFLNIYRNARERNNDAFKWGDEMEYSVVHFDEKEKRAGVSLQAEKILAVLQEKYNGVETNSHQVSRGPDERWGSHWSPEYSRFSIESCPAKPYQGSLEHLATVEANMRFNATVHSLMLFYIPMYSMRSEIAFSSGKTGGYLFLGNFVYTFTVITVCLKAGLESGTWTILTHIAVWGSFAIWLIFFGIYSHIFSILPLGSEMLGQADNVMASPVFWLGLILVPPMVLFRDLLWKVFRRRFQKSVVERVQELEVEHIDPQKTILDGARQSLSERAHLLRNMFGMGRNGSRTGSDLQLQEDRDRSSSLRSLQDANHGYAFSQEEGGVVSQSQLIRQYNTSNERGS